MSLEYGVPKLYQSYDYQLITYIHSDKISFNTIIFQCLSDSPLYGIILLDKKQFVLLYNYNLVEDSSCSRDKLKQLLNNIHDETEFCNNQYLEDLLKKIINFSEYVYIESWQKSCDYIYKFKQDVRMLTLSKSIKLYKYLDKNIRISDYEKYSDLYIIQHLDIINRYLIVQICSPNNVKKYNIIEVDLFYKVGYYRYGYIPNIRYSVKYFDCPIDSYKYMLENAYKLIHNYYDEKQNMLISYTPYNHNQDNSLDIDLNNLLLLLDKNNNKHSLEIS